MTARRLAARLSIAILLAAAVCLVTPATTFAQRGSSPTRGIATIDVLDIGQGDAILVRSPEGRTVLIDAGPSRVVVDRLRALGIEKLDMVVVSHQHTDHYGGMRAVIEAFEPKYYVSAGTKHVTPMYVRLLTLVRDRNLIALQTTDQPRKIQVGSVLLTMFPQPPESEESENDNSVGIRLEYGGFAMLMTGDSEDAERAWWVENVPNLARDCQVLKLAHHGSHNGTDDAWLKLVHPALAVCSCGLNNSFGHPHKVTLDRLERAGIPLRRTDEEGRITIRTNGRDWRVTTEKGGAAGGGGSRSSERHESDEEMARTQPANDTRVRSASAESDEGGEPVGTAARSTGGAWKRRRR
jgi:beta-lactamase superfamily II metal-dependent hydrolase